uniref:Uncharacterized protein n=1 Tax=Rhizophagus irregularis (strain DAOM 181602 / DAOM 197198 / MUCL 43194) TaxID=747089 RepID=U9UE25_RHIID
MACSKIFSGNMPELTTSMDEDEQVEKNLSQIIKSQQNLKKISFEYHFEYTLNYLKDSYCLNTLKTIIFYGIRFNSMVDFKEVFEQLNVLESVHILDYIKSLESLLQKSGDYIEYFGLRSRSHASKQQLLEVIKRYCTRIKFFELFEFDKKELWPTFDLIEDVGQNLNFISIDLHEFYIYQLDHDTELSSIILQNLDIYDFVNENLRFLSLNPHQEARKNKREVVGRRNAGNLATKLYENSTPEEVVDVISKLRKESSEDMNKRMDKRIELIERKSNGNYEITKSDCQQRGKK